MEYQLIQTHKPEAWKNKLTVIVFHEFLHALMFIFEVVLYFVEIVGCEGVNFVCVLF
jgi:hypothetical protein